MLGGVAEQLAAHQVGAIEQRRHGDWVGEPDQGDREGQIDPKEDGTTSRQQHLAGKGDPGHEEADREGTGGGAAVEVPEAGIEQQLAEQPQVLVLLELVLIGQPAFDESFGHV